MSSTAASNRCDAIPPKPGPSAAGPPCSDAPPAIVAARLPPVPKPIGTRSVSPTTTRTWSNRHAELVRRHLGQRRLVALAVRHLRGEHRHRAVVLEPHPHDLVAHDVAPALALEAGAASR